MPQYFPPQVLNGGQRVLGAPSFSCNDREDDRRRVPARRLLRRAVDESPVSCCVKDSGDHKKAGERGGCGKSPESRNLDRPGYGAPLARPWEQRGWPFRDTATGRPALPPATTRTAATMAIRRCATLVGRAVVGPREVDPFWVDCVSRGVGEKGEGGRLFGEYA